MSFQKCLDQDLKSTWSTLYGDMNANERTF